jgi:hypothetical protein
MPRLIAFLIALFGTIDILIALAHIIAGPAVIPGGMPVNATMDSEDRFYATLFLGYGCALWWCSRDIRRHAGMIHVLLLVFFLGGVARLVSVAEVGWPAPLFIALTAVELLLPLVLAAMLSSVVKSELPGRSPAEQAQA